MGYESENGILCNTWSYLLFTLPKLLEHNFPFMAAASFTLGIRRLFYRITEEYIGNARVKKSKFKVYLIWINFYFTYIHYFAIQTWNKTFIFYQNVKSVGKSKKILHWGMPILLLREFKFNCVIVYVKMLSWMRRDVIETTFLNTYQVWLNLAHAFKNK